MVKSQYFLYLIGVFCMAFCVYSKAIAEEKKQPKKMEKNFKERVMEKIPYSEEAKYLWDTVDGDIDLMGVKGLRGDRRNKGIQYKTNALPFVGKVSGTQFKFEMGEEQQFSFTSKTTPFIGNIKGLSYRGFTGTENSGIFARYTIALD